MIGLKYWFQKRLVIHGLEIIFSLDKICDIFKVKKYRLKIALVDDGKRIDTGIAETAS